MRAASSLAWDRSSVVGYLKDPTFAASKDLRISVTFAGQETTDAGC